MTAPRRSDLVRLALLIVALVAAVAIITVALRAAGRTSGQALAGAVGITGLGMAAAGLVMLVVARREGGRVTHLTAMGTIGLAVALLVASLII